MSTVNVKDLLTEIKTNLKQKNVKFKEVWKNYSIALSELKAGDGAIVQIEKQAENAMYQEKQRFYEQHPKQKR